MYGDADNDGIVDQKDRIVMARYLAAWDGYADKINPETADVDRNGIVEQKDRLILARYIADWIEYQNIPCAK